MYTGKMSGLLQNLQREVDMSVDTFCQMLSEKYDLNHEEMIKIWMDVSKSKKPPSKEKSSYVNYSIHIRSVFQKEFQDLSFGEISTEISKKWKALSQKEKDSYKENDINAKEDVLTRKTFKELKELCKQYKIKLSGKKAELIDRIEKHRNTQKPDENDGSSQDDSSSSEDEESEREYGDEKFGIFEVEVGYGSASDIWYLEKEFTKEQYTKLYTKYEEINEKYNSIKTRQEI